MRLLLGALLALALGGQALAAPPFWVVKDADTTLYLFGTMHILQPDAEWRTPAFDKAYASAGEVWFETDIDGDPQEMMKLMVDLGFDAERPLSTKLKPETREALAAALKKSKNADPAMFEMLRPWSAAMMLSVLPMIEAGFDGKAGADSTLERDADKAGKPVFIFETPEQQLRFFADLPEAVEVQFLEDTLGGADQTAEESEAMQQAWIDGDVDSLGPMILSAMQAERPELYQVLIRGRNAAWVEVLLERMDRPGVVMINVGALHMVGPDGLPEALTRRGLTVDRVQ